MKMKKSLKSILLLMAFIFLALAVSVFGLRITAPEITEINTTSVTITWTSDVESTTQVLYGTARDLNQIYANNSPVTYHSARLTNLSPNTKYYFYIFSASKERAEFASDDNNGKLYNFTTAPGADVRAPVISNISVATAETTTVIIWVTDEPATTMLWYGTARAENLAQDGKLTTDHRLSIPTEKGKVYRFVIGACDELRNCANTTEQGFVGGSTAAFLFVEVPSFVQENRIDIGGNTTPYAAVEVFVNGELKRKDVNIGADGKFFFRSVPLTLAENNITIKAIDKAGNTVSQSFTTTIDAEPPIIELANVSEAVTEPRILIKGRTNEPVTLHFSKQKVLDKLAPVRVSGLKAEERASVELSWEPNKEEDLLEYAVYRNGKRIAVTRTPSYTDTNVEPGVSYAYRVSAVDTSCNEGGLSDSVEITTVYGQEAVGEVPEVQFTCTPQETTKELGVGEFDIEIPLEEGLNSIKLRFTDRAGNSVEFAKGVIVDTQPPQILETNIDRLSPSYSPDVLIIGKVSENATVFVEVQGEKYFDLTDDKGNFRIPVTLKRDASIKITEKRAEAETGEGWKNHIKVQAIDIAGQKSDFVEGDVIYAICGFGSWFKVELSKPMPSSLTPRLMLEGQQQLGFGVNITYRGGYDAVIKSINVRPATLSPAASENYDQGWYRADINPSPRGKKSYVGYLRLLFTGVPDVPGKTFLEREEVLSNHRIGKCKTIPPGTGCFKGLLELEIKAQELIPIKPFTQVTGLPTEIQPSDITQKVCIDIESMIDRRVKPLAPRGLLKSSISLMDGILKGIDSVLKPVRTIGQLTLGGCFATNLLNWAFFVQERFACTPSHDLFETIKSFLGISEFKDVAEIGLCNVHPRLKDNPTAKDACNRCSSAIASRMKLERARNFVCDRIGCPAVPTLQAYIKEQQRDAGALKPVRVGDITYYKGSSCAFGGERGWPHVGKGAGMGDGDLTRDFTGIKRIYLDYLKHKNDKTPEGFSESPAAGPGVLDSEVNCAGLHPADPRCCGFEYMQQWGSGCGIPDGETLFNEIKESTCLAAQSSSLTAPKDLKRDANIDCSPNIFNAAAGFCDPEWGTPVTEPIELTGVRYNLENSLATSRFKDPDGRAAVFVAIAPGDWSVSGVPYIHQTYETTGYRVLRGQVADKLSFDQSRLPGDEQPSSKKDVKITTTGWGGYERRLRDRTEKQYQLFVNAETIFQPDGVDATGCFDTTKLPTEQQQLDCFVSTMCAGGEIANPDTCKRQAPGVFALIKQKVAPAEDSNIVVPGEGLLRSMQCVCIPAVQGHLEKWKQILTFARNCLNSIYLTGDGSAGACQAFVSQYLCDALFELLSCATKKYGYAAGGRARGEGIGDLIGTITAAGNDAYRSAQQRYGQTPTFQTLFVERKLVNSICLFAFTGTWDLDLTAMYQQAVQEFPIDSTGAIFRAERRFVAFNPGTRPAGLTTWNYHLGLLLAAGTDLNYKLELKCSNSQNCDTAAGFKNGRCDCYGQPEKRVFIPVGTGHLKRGEILGAGPEGEIFHVIEATDPASSVRYDTAILSWEWIDPRTNEVRTGKVEKRISLVGGDAPAFCGFDTFALAYRCEFGLGQYAGARLDKVEPVYPSEPPEAEKAKLFVLGKELKFDVQITKQTPPELRQPASSYNRETKFLVYEVKNSHGAVIRENKELPEVINEDGTFTKTIKTRELTEEDFVRTLVAGFGFDLVYWEPSLQTTDKWLSGEAANRLVAVVDRQPAAGTFVVVGYPDSTFEVYLTTGGPVPAENRLPPTEPQGKGLSIGERLKGGSWGYYAKQELVAGNPVPSRLLAKGTIGRDNVISYSSEGREVFKLTLSQRPPSYFEIVLRAVQAAAACNPNEPVTFTATFALYDALTDFITRGPNFNQITTDPSTGEQQKKTITFQAVCNSKPPKELVPPLFERCSADASIENMVPCICSERSDEELKNVLKTGTEDEKRMLFNCGVGNPVDGTKRYCGYDTRDGKVVRVCREKAETEPKIVQVLILSQNENGEFVVPANPNELEAGTPYVLDVKTNLPGTTIVAAFVGEPVGPSVGKPFSHAAGIIELKIKAQKDGLSDEKGIQLTFK
ncbi:MAG: hypothetical protein QW559_00505 [Candidatus Woesearchaeota archaeon]